MDVASHRNSAESLLIELFDDPDEAVRAAASDVFNVTMYSNQDWTTVGECVRLIGSLYPQLGGLNQAIISGGG